MEGSYADSLGSAHSRQQSLFLRRKSGESQKVTSLLSPQPLPQSSSLMLQVSSAAVVAAASFPASKEWMNLVLYGSAP